MDDLDIILPCGFSRKFKEIFNTRDKLKCRDCKSHDITQEDCLNIARNKLIINQRILELKLKKFADCVEKINYFKTDPKHYVDESYTKIKNIISLRREEIKLNFNQKIDEYFENLQKQVDCERESSYVVIYDRLKQISLLEQEVSNFNVGDLDVYSKINLIKNYKKKIDVGTNFVQNTIEKFSMANLKLMESDESINISRLFGELYLDQETNIVSNENGQDIDDDGREEATFQFVVNSFSKCKMSKNLKLISKPFIIRNIEWTIVVEFHETCLGCFVVYKPILCNSNVDAESDFRLLNKIDRKKNWVKNYKNFSFKPNYNKCGFDNFINFDKILDEKNCFYNQENDFITFEVKIKAQLPQSI